MMSRFVIVCMLMFLLIPQVYGGISISESGSLSGTPTAIAAVDTDSNGVPDTAVVGTLSRAVSAGSGSWDISVANVEGIAAVDFDKNGYLNSAAIAGTDIVAVDYSGFELWRAEKMYGKSIAAADLDRDGYENEVVVGCSNKVAAFDSNGESLWNYTGPSGILPQTSIVVTKSSIITGGSNMLYFLKYNGDLRTTKVQNDIIVALAPIDLAGDGTLNGVVVITRDESRAYINAYSMYGEDMGWKNELYHASSVDISAYPIDKYSRGKKDTVIFNLDGGAYWVTSNGATSKIGGVYLPGAVAPIDFDRDGILDDVIVAKKGGSVPGKIYAYNAVGQELGSDNQTGGVKVAAVDLNFDGWADDFIIATSYDRNLYNGYSSDMSDSTTGTVETTTTTTTTIAGQDTTTTTQAPSGTAGISVDLGQNQTVASGTEVTLTATATPSTSGGSIVSYLWMENGTTLLVGTAGTFKKVFSSGVYEVKVVITDNTLATAEDTVTITVTDGAGTPSGADSDSDGWTDAFEIQLGTDVNNPDTDGDGILDSVDPNPLVAGSSDGLSGLSKYLGPVFGVAKWIIIAFVIILVFVFAREKILDTLWEMRGDTGE